MEYDNELKELTGIDTSVFDGVSRCPECGLIIDQTSDICDVCGCFVRRD